jgi:hypothetical protein
VAITEHILDLGHVQRLHDGVCNFTVQLLAQDRRVPVEIARKAFDYLRVNQDARFVTEE